MELMDPLDVVKPQHNNNKKEASAVKVSKVSNSQLFVYERVVVITEAIRLFYFKSSVFALRTEWSISNKQIFLYRFSKSANFGKTRSHEFVFV